MVATKTSVLLLTLALLACSTPLTYARPHVDHEQGGDVTITVAQGADVLGDATPYTDQILYNLTHASCRNSFLTWMAAQRCLRVLGQAQYEAIAPYSDHSQGFLTGGKHRTPKHMRTLTNMKISVYQSIFTAMATLYKDPAMTTSLSNVLTSIAMNPGDNSTDPATAVGIGNLAGLAVVEYSMNDGSNQDGSLSNKYNKKPYSDYTGYAPVNSAYNLTDKSRWQPLISTVRQPDGQTVQHFSGSHACSVKTLGLPSATSFQCKKPGKWNRFGTKEYLAAAEAILDYNRRIATNDTAKINAEFLDAVPYGVINFMRATAAVEKWTFEEEVRYNFAFYAAAWDTALVTLCCKRTYDTIRPISVIRHSGLYTTVRAYAGQEYGVVDMPAKDWTQYNWGTAPEPEYPSGAAAAICSFAQIGELISGRASFGAKIRFPAGMSIRETGLPKQDVVFDFRTWDEVHSFAREGRLYGGVHFPVAVVEADRLGSEVSKQTYQWATALFQGKGKHQ